MSLRGNRGEWSEVYVLLRTLAEGRLQASDGKLDAVEGSVLHVAEIIRQHRDRSYHYTINADDVVVSVVPDGSVLESIQRAEIAELADVALIAISQGGFSFDIPALQTLLAKLRVTELKLTGSNKGDIDMRIHDQSTASTFAAAYSIKSQLGSPSTLLNASGATNFEYEIVGDGESKTLAGLKHLKGKKLVQQLYANGFKLEYLGMCNDTFESNLRMIDGQMPVVVATLLRLHYEGRGARVAEVLEALIQEDPCGYGKSSELQYRHKVKTLLHAVALGMTPAREWDGSLTADGGYVVVKKLGQLACFPSARVDAFRDHLLDNTKFERASTSRHRYGRLFEDEGTTRIRLNLQIRFI
jgi:type II restriction enzyme